jgi:hypothetical protein
VPDRLHPEKKMWPNGMSMWSWRISLTDNWAQARPIQASLRQDSKKENLQEPLTTIDNGRGKDKCTVSTLPTSWVDYKSCLFTNVWLQNFDLCKCSTLQFSASHLPTSHDDSFPTNHVPNPLDGESEELVSSDSEGYIETEVDWFDEPQPVEIAKQYPSKMLETVTSEVCLWCICPSPH